MSIRNAAILLSRQPRRPCRTTPWVENSCRALRWIRSKGLYLVTSVGMPTWELVCAEARNLHIPQTIILPLHDPEDFEPQQNYLRSQLDLPPETTFIPVLPNAPDEPKRTFLSRRDQLVIEHAELLIPVSIRPDGIMSRLTSETDKTVMDLFQTKYTPREKPLKYTIPTDRLNPGLCELPHTCLIHWTRTTNHPWPDERLLDFYRALIRCHRYPRSAMDTLQHILATGRLIGSTRHMPHDRRCVAFSSLTPDRAIPLMRWRARYGEMSFEPYGIGIEIKTALNLGIREVNYYDPEKEPPPDNENRWRWQSIGTKTDWRQENEYRFLGDLNLHKIPRNKLLIFCRYPREAATIVTTTGLPAMAIQRRDEN